MKASLLLLVSLLIAFATVAFSVPVDQTADNGEIVPAGDGELLDGDVTVNKRNSKKKTKPLAATTDGPAKATKKPKKGKHTTAAPADQPATKSTRAGKKGGKKAGKSKDKTKNRRAQKNRAQQH